MDGSRLIEFLIIMITAWSGLSENARCSGNGTPEPSFAYYVDDAGNMQRLNKSINPRYYGRFGCVDATQSPILKPNTFASEKSAVPNNEHNSEYFVSDSYGVRGKTYYNPLYHVFGVAPNNNNNDKTSPAIYYPEIYPHHQQPVPVSSYWSSANSFDDPYAFYYDETSEEFPENKEEVLVTSNSASSERPSEVAECLHSAPLFRSFVLTTQRPVAETERVNANRTAEKEVTVVAENFATNTTGIKNFEDTLIRHTSTTPLPDIRIISERGETAKQKASENAQRVIDYLIDLGTKRRKIPFRHQIMRIPHLRNTTRHRSKVPLSLKNTNFAFNRLDDNIRNSAAIFNEV